MPGQEQRGPARISQAAQTGARLGPSRANHQSAIAPSAAAATMIPATMTGWIM